ncbi:MAG: histidinol-phosphate aminotransferase family protein [Candidatus Cloacimonetes bacterium]|nr:histidinol-phosphate aminotransferase family protein [Candidatus Cloacimonadota bacterium]
MTSETINLQYTTIKDPLPDFIYEGLREYCKDTNRYHPQPPELIEKLSKKHNLPKEMIFLTAGVDEAIQLFALTFGQNAYVFTPTYVVYSDVTEFGGKLTRVNSVKGSEFIISTDKIPNATLIFLANPNNPSGFTPKEKVLELIRNNQEAVVVVDEAYAEFANLSVIDQVENYPNMVVLRSFSKSYALAGARIGFVVAAPEIISKIKPKTQWCNVSYLSAGAAMVALEHEDYFANMREAINQEREDFTAFLKSQGFAVFPSKINAVLVKFNSENEGTRFVKYLAERSIVVSHGNGNSNIGLDESYVRIAIGNKEQMGKVKEIIGKYKR